MQITLTERFQNIRFAGSYSQLIRAEIDKAMDDPYRIVCADRFFEAIQQVNNNPFFLMSVHTKENGSDEGGTFNLLSSIGGLERADIKGSAEMDVASITGFWLLQCSTFFSQQTAQSLSNGAVKHIPVNLLKEEDREAHQKMAEGILFSIEYPEIFRPFGPVMHPRTEEILRERLETIQSRVAIMPLKDLMAAFQSVLQNRTSRAAMLAMGEGAFLLNAWRSINKLESYNNHFPNRPRPPQGSDSEQERSSVWDSALTPLQS